MRENVTTEYHPLGTVGKPREGVVDEWLNILYEGAKSRGCKCYSVTDLWEYPGKVYLHSIFLSFRVGVESLGAVSGARRIRLSFCLMSQDSSKALSFFTLSCNLQC